MTSVSSWQPELTEHSQFFNNLVDLIPARFYRDEEDRIDMYSLNKAEKKAAKEELRTKAKLNKLAKLSGGLETATGPSDDDPSSSGKPAEEAKHAAALLNIPTGNASRDELQEKLHQRLLAMRAQRQQDERKETAKKAKDWKQKTLEQNVKRKLEQESQKPPHQQQGNNQQKGVQKGVKRKPDSEVDAAPTKKQAHSNGSGPAAATAGVNAANGFAFPRIELDEGQGAAGSHGGHKGAKKPSKEQLLKVAEAKQKERAEAPEEAKPKVAGEAWKAAMMRAGGEKVLDDPKLLRKSLKKEAKRKEKSAKGWEERNAAQKEQQDYKQNKRKENLQHRSKGRIDKKKSKRENKLLRAGFEGRKAGFIGDSSKASPAAAKGS